MGLTRIVLLGISIAVAGCASAAAPASEPQARTPETVPAEAPAPPATAAAPAPPPTVEVPPATSEVAPASADPPSDAGSTPSRLDHLDDREKLPPENDAVKGTAIVSNVSVSGAAVSNAARVVAGMRAGFRGCYNRSLQQNPKSQGQIRLTIEVQPDGAVHSVTSAPIGVLSEGSVACVTARARVGQFAATDGGSATVTATVTFLPP